MIRNIELKKAIFEEDTTQREIAKKTCIPENLLSLAIHGKFNLNMIQKAKIADALKRDVTELFE